MTIVYPVIFTRTKDEKDTYLIEIPDLKGMTEGYGMADAIYMARDYIGGVCYGMNEEDLPHARKLEEINISEGEFTEQGESFLSLVDTDLDEYRKKLDNKAVRRNVSIPNWLNKAAEKEHINVSRVLQEALMERLNIVQ